jgi:hypothetical protein
MPADTTHSVFRLVQHYVSKSPWPGLCVAISLRRRNVGFGSPAGLRMVYRPSDLSPRGAILDREGAEPWKRTPSNESSPRSSQPMSRAIAALWGEMKSPAKRHEPDPPSRRDTRSRCGGVFAADGGRRRRHPRTVEGRRTPRWRKPDSNSRSPVPSRGQSDGRQLRRIGRRQRIAA